MHVEIEQHITARGRYINLYLLERYFELNELFFAGRLNHGGRETSSLAKLDCEFKTVPALESSTEPPHADVLQQSSLSCVRLSLASVNCSAKGSLPASFYF